MAIVSGIVREYGLSFRETEVLCATALGHSTKEIAFTLCISTKTVEYYWERIFKKLLCGSKVEAMALLFRRASGCAAPEASARRSRKES